VTVPVTHASPRPGELQASALRIERAAAVLGWRPATGLGEGLRRTYDWILADAP
jgi:nucleoside-diphosphate-sugar epimerase